MEIPSVASHAFDVTSRVPETPDLGVLQHELEARKTDADDPELRKAFNDFVGQTFFGQMLGAMRKTVDKSAYMHGGRTEEVFQAQLDQVLAEKLSDASAESFTDPMWELFNLPRR